MFFKLSVVVTSVMIGLAAGVPSNPPPLALCCNVVRSSSEATDILGSTVGSLLNIYLAGVTVPIGLGCKPITVIGNNCNGTTVNCDSVQHFGGTPIAIKCLPITL
ncbi:fungal hydrophobin [Mycena vulgaris]|nr:fungal hydrophobin [Mycena vulgaris]